MMPEIPRHLKITIGILLGAVIGGAVHLRFLARRIYAPAVSEQKTVQTLAQQSLASPADVLTPVTLYLPEIPGAGSETTQPVAREVKLPLATEPGLRAKQLLLAWLAANQESPHSLVPSDARLREVFLASDGTAYVDFSTEFATHAISGIASEMLVVSSLADTLAGNLNSIQKVKILINGQEVETLAGHVDLERFYAPDIAVAPATTEESSSPPITPAAPAPPPR